MFKARHIRDRMKLFSLKFIGADDGASAAEYGLLAALIAFGILAAVYLFSARLSSFFSHALDRI